ncbi:MAG TPA: glycosyltransferase family 4 protein [Acidobacteriaceae bacterium]
MSASSAISPASRPIFLAEFGELGGAERCCLALADWLHERNLPCHFVTYRNPVDIAQFAKYPLPVVELKPEMRARKKIAALRAYFASRQPSAPQVLTNGYQEAMHATLAGLRGFHTLMHDTPALFGDAGQLRTIKQKLRLRISNAIIGYGLRSGGRTFVNSEFLRADSRKDFGADAEIVRMGGMGDPQNFVPRRVEGTLNLLSVSRVEANKRIDWMLRALAELERGANPLSSRVDWHLHIAGKGSLVEPLRSMAAELGIGPRAHFHGFVTDAQLEQLYAQAHLFLMPAVQGYGIPAIESLQRGIPILLHRQSGVSDILLNTPWATVLHGGEEEMPSKLAEAIEGVITGRQLAEPLPELPTEAGWSEEIARRCGWL